MRLLRVLHHQVDRPVPPPRPRLPAHPPPRAGIPRPRRTRLYTPSATFLRELAALRDLLPAASPDLSHSAVAGWPAYSGATCPRCGAFYGPDPPLRTPPCGLCSAA